ncbi:MAG: hypothetical protein Phyf2KO_14760 [Phycisphaerales bacterium]
MKLLLCILLLMQIPIAASAQRDRRDQQENEVTILADFGFADSVPGARFGPVRVHVRAQDENISGRIELEYIGSDGFTGRVIAPVDVAAGGETTVSMVVPIPALLDEVNLTLRDQRGGRIAESGYATLPSSTQIQFPTILAPSQELLLSCTSRVSAADIAELLVQDSLGYLPAARIRSVRQMLELTPEQATHFVFSNLVGESVLVDSLPLSHRAYEGVLAIIVDSTTVLEADPRAIIAMHRWVIGGGRLIVLADMPGDQWRRLIPPTVPIDAITLGAQQAIGVPAEFETLTGNSAREPLISRPIWLTLAAEDAGWSTRWKSADGNLLAEGPAGFGWVTLVGMRPGVVSGGGQTGEMKLWADVLTGASRGVYMPDHSHRTLLTRGRSYGELRVVEDVPVLVFDAIGSATPIGSAAVALVALITVSLALALGPVDFVLLKLIRLRHMAWLSALVWIVLASIIGFLTPNKMRSGSSTLGRHTLVDTIAINSALTGAESNPQNARVAELPDVLRSWSLSFSNYFAGSADLISVSPAKNGLYWTEYQGVQGRSAVTRPMVTVQNPNSGSLDATRSSTPAPIRPGIWTTKVFIDSGPVVTDLEIALGPTDEGWSLTVDGLNADRLIAGQLRVGDRFIPIRARDLIPENTQRFRLNESAATSDPIGLYDDPLKWDDNRRYLHNMYSNVRLDSMSQSLLQLLPGPSERSHSIEKLLATNRYALVELFVAGQQLNVTIEANDVEPSQSTMYRILVPIEGDPARD